MTMKKKPAIKEGIEKFFNQYFERPKLWSDVINDEDARSFLRGILGLAQTKQQLEVLFKDYQRQIDARVDDLVSEYRPEKVRPFLVPLERRLEFLENEISFMQEEEGRPKRPPEEKKPPSFWQRVMAFWQ